MTTRFHARADKEWAKKEVRKYGPAVVLGIPELTVADALQMIDDAPSPTLSLGEECDNLDPETGLCRGHAVRQDAE